MVGATLDATLGSHAPESTCKKEHKRGEKKGRGTERRVRVKSVRGSPIEGRRESGAPLSPWFLKTFAEKARVPICRRIARFHSLVYDVTWGAYCFLRQICDTCAAANNVAKAAASVLRAIRILTEMFGSKKR